MSTVGKARNACADPGVFHYQRPDRDEDQCMREVPVKLDVQQRVVCGMDQDIGVGQQRGNKTDDRRRARVFLSATDSASAPPSRPWVSRSNL
jgi:hypothetical protein